MPLLPPLRYPHPALIGTTLGHFELTAKLGEGGMGEVYRAVDGRLGREVAVKVLPESFVTDRDRVRRFEREAKLLASLSHPNIATIHEVGVEEGRHFLVMELVPGETLAERLDRGPLAVGEALRVAAEIASALEAAYQHGVVHRDLKPSNVKLTGGGRVKLLDFGLGKALAPPPGEGAGTPADDEPTATHHPTAPGVVLGTPGYMSPEQVRGRPVDARTDLWALGVVLWEMLTGTPLFRCESASETVAAVLGREIDLARLPAATPPPVRTLLRRLLSRDPEYRLRHPGDVWLELEEARRVQPGEAAEASGASAREPARASVESYGLTMEICRELDRDHLVPEMIGDELRFLDNGRASDVLAVHIPALGADHEQFREVVERSPYRGLAVSPYGWQEDTERRPSLSLGDHLTILGHFLADAVERLRPARTVLVGFSSGADMALRLPSEARVATPRVDAILALGPNVSLATCFFTSRIAAIRSESPEEMLETIRQIGASTESLEEWSLLTPFLLQVARRFRSDIPTLRTVAREIVEPFERPGISPFAGWYRDVKAQGIEVRAVFCNASYDQEGLARLRMQHLDSGVLGPDFEEGDLVTERKRNHFELLSSGVVAERIGELVASSPGSEGTGGG